jgi:RNA polymerase sigma factor (sigma-70 family)
MEHPGRHRAGCLLSVRRLRYCSPCACSGERGELFTVSRASTNDPRHRGPLVEARNKNEGRSLPRIERCAEVALAEVGQDEDDQNPDLAKALVAARQNLAGRALSVNEFGVELEGASGMVKKSLRKCLQHVFKLAAVQTARQLGDGELLERFVAAKDGAAFAVLVQRHASMVLGVCRRMLGSVHDAEDACQAAFLVLAQKAASIRKTTSLSSWLHGAAWRVASHVRRERLRRSNCQRQIQEPAVADPAAEVSWREVQTVLDEELKKLPDNLRAPLILCYLEGLTRDAAAQQLGLSVACLHGRLERGRKTLGTRLTRRGVTLPAALLAAAVGEGVVRAAVPPTAILATAKAAMLIGSGRALHKGLISARVLSLAQEVTRNMFLTNWKLGAAALVAATLMAAALGSSLVLAGADEAKTSSRTGSPRPTAAEARKSAAPEAPKKARPSGKARLAESERKRSTVAGRVLGPDSKPVAGAKVYLLKWTLPPWLDRSEGKAPPKVWALADKDGRFSFNVGNRDLGELFVTAAGYGPGWVIKPGKLQETWPIEKNQLVRLARDDVAVHGRLLNLEGLPVAGVTVRVFALKASPDGRLDPFIKAVKNKRPGQSFPEHEHLSSYRVDGLSHFFPPLTTDKAGRFQIKGVGRERIVAFTIEGPTIETKVINVLTKPGLKVGDIRLDEGGIITPTGMKAGRLKPYYPPTFTHAAAPCRVIIGVVRDKATRQPIAGAVVRSEQPVRYPLYYNRTTTDPKGRFRLPGMPVNPGFGPQSSVVAVPPEGQPYLALQRPLPRDKEGKLATFDFDLPPGVWLEGQVKDKTTGRGVRAQLRYFTLGDGELDPGQLAGSGGPYYYRDPYRELMTDMDGKFRLVAARQRGVLGALAGPETSYRTGVGADKIKGGTKDATGRIVFRNNPLGFSAEFFNTVVEVKPKKGARHVRCDIVLDPGRTLKIQVRGPDGKPVDGIRAQGLRAGLQGSWSQKPLPSEFTVSGLEPGKGRTVLLEHPRKNLVAHREIKGDERGPVVVTLQPAGTVVGRLIDDFGRPLANAEITIFFTLGRKDNFRSPSRPFRTDARGNFRIEGLFPGLPYHAHVGPASLYTQIIFNDLSLKSGQTKDLGTMKPKKFDG